MSGELLAAEHPRLVQAAIDLVAHLATVRERLHHGEVMHYQHTQFAERVWSLHTYLQGALALVELNLYMPAFATLRSALEHHVQDHLLFLGNRYTATVRDVPDETLAEWQQAIEEGREDFAGILEVRRVGRDRAEVVRSGPHYTGGGMGPDAPGLSIYYSIIFDFDPFTGGKGAQEFIGEWSPREDAQHRFAARAADIWASNLVWRQLKANLSLNGFYTETELARWEVHFSFMSAFTHPTARGLNIVYGRNSPKAIRYDHYASELILLYIITIARLELEVFEEMARRDPVVDLAGWDRVRADIERGAMFSSHLWFPRGSPHEYDRVQEANRLGVSGDGRLVPWEERPKPDEVAEEDVFYYSNPLRRIIALHAHQNEVTGFPYVSPWPRADAWQRSID